MPDIMSLLSQFHFSDFLIFAAVPFALWFTLSYAIGSPWYTHPLGIITLLTSLSVCSLLVLIVYGMITGERIGEPIRVLVALGLLVSYLAKTVILHVERHRGRIARRHHRGGGVPATGEVPVHAHTPGGGDSDE